MRFSVLTTFNPRRRFDPNSQLDLQELKYFLENYQWKNNCPFYLEDIYEDIPTMCKDKLVAHVLKSF
jgi:hypothetical protein